MAQTLDSAGGVVQKREAVKIPMPPYCLNHGCRHRWHLDLPHTCKGAMMSTHTELATGKVETISADAAYIRDLVHDREVRFTNASNAGAELTSIVYSFLSDPEGVGTDVVRIAYEKFMGKHSGNFHDVLLGYKRTDE